METIIRFAVAMLDAGADVIVLSDPTASGEIIGPQNFKTFIPAYRRIFEAIHTRGAKGLLHICGDVMPIIDLIKETGADGFSFGDKVALQHGDLMEVMWEGMGRPLKNVVNVTNESQKIMAAEAM